MRRLRRFVICAAVVLAVLAAGHGRFEPTARADPGLVVGVDDDTLKWSFPGWHFIDSYEELRLSAIRVTLRWRPGEASLDRLGRLYVNRVADAQMKGNRVVLSIFGAGRAAPATPEERDAYCSYVVDALRTAPSLHDVVIWNEVNSRRFWRPPGQRRAAAYVALLARCYDLVHQTFPRRFLNVISSTAPRHDPRSFIAELGAAYRASGRTTRIFDTFGHNPYPATNAEPPSVEHPGSRMLGEGDYGALMDALTAAFAGTGQPVPGEDGVSLWYLEDGFETAVPADRAGRYSGRERASVVQPVGHAAAARDQASQLRDAVELAYCQPAVGAFFNFQLVDEEGLGGWQSGLLWADGRPKPSYAAFRKVVADVRAGRSTARASRPPPSAPKPLRRRFLFYPRRRVARSRLRRRFHARPSRPRPRPRGVPAARAALRARPRPCPLRASACRRLRRGEAAPRARPRRGDLGALHGAGHRRAWAAPATRTARRSRWSGAGRSRRTSSSTTTRCRCSTRCATAAS